jgi:small subunit ribosomal protein S15e
MNRRMGKRYIKFIRKLIDAKKKCENHEKPKPIKTHLRDCIILPQMVNSSIKIHNGQNFKSIEIKPEMIGYYLGEFAPTYKKVNHGRPGVGATKNSFIPKI